MFVLVPQLLLGLLLRVSAYWLRAGRDERGASAVEYGLLIAGIAAVIVGSVFLLGQGVFLNLFTKTCNSIGVNTGTAC